MASVTNVALPDCFGRPTCDPAPVCPACGGLECLCRPRFFAGQMLSEDDLNRLDHYIQAKNRLHNRHLHGWGVSCGLEVVCGVCEPDQRHVLVKPGYALSPCGNDIIVCKPTSVDICDLISRCRPPADDCHDLVGQPPPPADQPVPGAAPAGDDNRAAPGDCGGGTEEWVLAICYSEKPSRGIAALRATPADCGCGCGGHGKSSGGCGCGGNGDKSSSGHKKGGDCDCGCGGSTRRKAPTPRSIPEQCEPTVVCEGYRFVVYKAPKRSARDRQYGAAARRFLCCLAPLLNASGDASDIDTPAEAQAWALAVLDAVREFIMSEGLYDCRLAKRLSAIVIPEPGNTPPAVYLAQLSQAVASIVAIGAIAWQKCFCAAILPPCPEPSQSDCVPLATVTVTRSSCCVQTICNMSARKFLVTIPNLQYWLSFVDLFTGSNAAAGLRQVLERLCCRPTREYQDSVRNADFFANARVSGVRSARRARRAAPGPVNEPAAASTLLNALGSPERRVGIEHLLLGALGARNAEGEPYISDEEMVNPANFLVLNQIVAPLLRAVVPAEVAPADVAAGLGAASADRQRLDDLSRELDSLRTTVERQEKTIARLKKNK
ncbi:MAG: hypothetical protein EHM55_00185 [Acidobacteria bacterium]|nr:MAG: hypothetical protein EHM55_00185 [Acidobacteriota bacterium]